MAEDQKQDHVSQFVLHLTLELAIDSQILTAQRNLNVVVKF